MYIDLITIDLCPGQGGGVRPSETIEITSNGVYDVYSYASASVSVHPSNSLSETYTSNGSYNITGEFNGGLITIEVPAPQFITETLSVSLNGTYMPSVGVDGFSEVIVDVPQSVTGFTEKEYTEGQVVFVNLSNSASYVASSAFKQNNILQTVYLPNCSIVNDYAFYLCRSISSVYLPNCTYVGKMAFEECNGLSELNLPNCTSTDSRAFYSCTSLETIYMPNLESFGPQTFANLFKLRSIDLPKISVIPSQGFAYDRLLESVNIPECTFIGQSAFINCSSLTEIHFPKCSNMDGFYQCSSLSIIDIPNCLRISGAGYCSALTNISYQYVSRVESYAFRGCNNIRNIDLPLALSIGTYAFNGAKSIERLNVPILSGWSSSMFDNMSAITEVSLGNRLYFVPAYSSAYGLSQIDTSNCSIYVDAAMYDKWISEAGWSSLSSAFVSFGDPTVPMISVDGGRLYGKTYAVYNNLWRYNISSYDITEIDLPECRLLYNAFTSWNKVTSISLPECLLLGDNEFASCYSLTTLTLPKCRCIFGVYNFRECYRLSELILPGSYVCLMEASNNFTGNSVTNIYVPASLVDTYKSAPNWSLVSSRIFPISE